MGARKPGAFTKIHHSAFIILHFPPPRLNIKLTQNFSKLIKSTTSKNPTKTNQGHDFCPKSGHFSVKNRKKSWYFPRTSPNNMTWSAKSTHFAPKSAQKRREMGIYLLRCKMRKVRFCQVLNNSESLQFIHFGANLLHAGHDGFHQDAVVGDQGNRRWQGASRGHRESGMPRGQ